MSEIVVIKIGGSLLSEPGALARIGGWLEATRCPGQTRLVLAGGGEAVEALRSVDAANPLPAAAAHWAAIGIMDTHTRLLPTWLPELRITTTLPTERLSAGDVAFVCEPFLRDFEPHHSGEPLNVGWTTTSDAIAARLAEVCCGRLVLLKHSLETEYATLASACNAGAIDPETPRQAASLVGVELIGVVSPGWSPSEDG